METLETFTDYINKEQKNILRYLDLFPEDANIQYKILNEGFSACDLIIRNNKNGKVYLIEFKSRQCIPSTYRDTMLEVAKVEGMKKLAKKLNVEKPIMLFVACFLEGSMYQFNVVDFDRVGVDNCPRYTADKSKGNKNKDCIYFNISTKNKLI
jgi:hypothetical protein